MTWIHSLPDSWKWVSGEPSDLVVNTHHEFISGYWQTNRRRPFAIRWGLETSKLLTSFIASDQKTARSEGRLSNRYSFLGSWGKTLYAQTNPARSGRGSKQSLFWHPHLQPTQTLRRNEVSCIEWSIPALSCVQGRRPTTRNLMDYDNWITFNNNMNDLNDGKDRLILMGTLFIVLFLFLL